ncbi:long-chain-fatty-acid--CoA ligase [Streptomyces sp. NPDC001292]|uniref:long-chain-fatty-acid--CoA ligase n=1 Tax=Streptomyces sp. NPDC001292 TaxID=3364558 RepID=UPI0036B1E8B7
MVDNLTIGHVIRRAAAQYPQRRAVIYEGRTYTYAEYNRRVNRAAHALTGLGIGFGDHVAILGRNSVEYLELCHASAKIGAVFGTVNWRLAPKEISFIVTDSDSKMLVIEAGFQDTVASVIDDLAGVTLVVFDGAVILPGALSYEDLVAVSSDAEPKAELDSSDEALIMYTSGTTGLPKGAVLTHGNICWDAISYLTYAPPMPYDCLLVGMPMNHVSGLHIQTTSFLIRGLPLVIMRQWDPAEACRLIEQHRVTVATILVTPLQQLLELPELRSHDLSSLRLVLSAAAKYTRDLPINAMHALSLERFLFAYGLTEAAPLVTITEFSGEALARENTLGFPLWYNDVRIVDELDQDVPDGRIGELIVRGPNVFKGYYKRPEANAEVLRRGWLHTGDLAYYSDNHLFFVDRKKDMIKSGGENVYSLEVEMGLLAANPQLAEVSVIGVPDDRWGEAVNAVVVLRPGSRLTAEQLIANARSHLAGYKLPKRVHFVDELPKNVSGKVLKTRLRDLVATGWAEPAASPGAGAPLEDAGRG